MLRIHSSVRPRVKAHASLHPRALKGKYFTHPKTSVRTGETIQNDISF